MIEEEEKICQTCKFEKLEEHKEPCCQCNWNENWQPKKEDEAKITDNVNHPSHYTFGKYEVIDVLEDWFKNDPLAWQCGKYLARYKHKNKPVEDLKKCRFYLDRLISRLENDDAE